MRGCSLSCLTSLILGGVLLFSILTIHTVLLKERTRIEGIEKQIIAQQKQWSEVWLQARQEDKMKASALESKAEENAQKILEAVEQVAEAAPADGFEPSNTSEEITEDKVEEILKDNLAVNPDAGLAPDYHDDRIAGSMDIDQPNEPIMVEENHGQVPSPIAPDHDPVVEHKKVSRKLMIKAQYYPQLLIMGVKNCGTIPFGRYLKIHPDLVNAGETFFFAKTFNKGLNYYKSLMPNSTEDQIVFERTANYYRLPVVPDRVRNFNRTLKMIMVTCDPVRRSLSDFFHLHRKDEEPVQVGDFEAKLDPVLTKMENDLAKIKEDNPETWFEDVYRMYKDRTNWFNYTDTYSNLIINGAYAIYYRRWIENFDRSQILVVDGTDMLANPSKWVTMAQDYIGVRQVVTEKNFILNEDTGYYCYMPPNDDTKYCLSSAQEKTPAKTMTTSFRDRLNAFYKDFNEIFEGQIEFDQPLNWNWSPEA